MNYKNNVIQNNERSRETAAKNELQKNNISEDKKILLNAMLISIEAVKIYAKRFSELAGKMYENTKEERLLKIQNALLKVPYAPCENIHEAISAVWLMGTCQYC